MKTKYLAVLMVLFLGVFLVSCVNEGKSKVDEKIKISDTLQDDVGNVSVPKSAIGEELNDGMEQAINDLEEIKDI